MCINKFIVKKKKVRNDVWTLLKSNAKHLDLRR